MRPRATFHPLQALLLVLFVFVLIANVVPSSFEKLGLSSATVSTILTASLLGSFVNVPVWVRRRHVANAFAIGQFVFRTAPETTVDVVAVNLGGAVIPTLVSIWLLPHAPVWKVAVAVVLVAAMVHRVAVVVPGRGIQTPAMLPPVVAAALGWLLAGLGGPQAAPIAFIGGTLGTLIGADLWNLGRLLRTDDHRGIMSIGGAGVFDGVFLVGLVAAFLV